MMRRARHTARTVAVRVYDQIVREGIESRLAQPPVSHPAVVARYADDGRDPIEIARAANLALKGAVA